MRDMAINHFDKIMQVLKSMPRPMLLVFRNINTVRCINITLGAPVDRYFIMAKWYEEGGFPSLLMEPFSNVMSSFTFKKDLSGVVVSFM